MTEQSKKDTIWLDENEYSIVSSDIRTKYSNKSVKNGFVYSANYVYFVEDIKYGNFKVIKK